MTTITPDFPDWTPGQVSAAASRLLYQSPAYEQLPVIKGLFDVRAYNSIDIVVDSHDITSLSLLAVTVMWQTQGLTTHVDFLTCGNGYTSPSGVCTSAFTLPCRGDYVTVRIIGGNPQKDVFFTVTASSRVVGDIVAMNSSGNEGQLPVEIDVPSLAAGGSITAWFGPVSKAVQVGVQSSSTTMAVQIFTYYLLTGNWSPLLVSPTLLSGAHGDGMVVQCPNRLMACIVTNLGAAAASAHVAVMDAS